MVSDPFGSEAPELQDVLNALDDSDCRAIVEALVEPMTAKELSKICDVPLTTCYQKLELLTEGSLLEEQVEVRGDGQHTTCDGIAFDEVRIELA